MITIHNRYDTLQKQTLMEFAQEILKASVDTRKIVKFHPTEMIIPTFDYGEEGGALKLSSIRNKVENNIKLSKEDHYNIVFIPLIGNVDSVKSTYKLIHLVNRKDQFTEDEQRTINGLQFIIADGNKKLFNEYIG